MISTTIFVFQLGTIMMSILTITIISILGITYRISNKSVLKL